MKLADWLTKSPAGLKRIADWLEKTSVATLAIGVFQAQTALVGFMGIIVSIISGAVSYWLTLKVEKESK
ncbi:MAG: hypothetical protein LBP89_05600 [Helicobacteraceae bacterium]|nr:hypothetical protein [Helicobacteraceae bacterium]